MFRDIREKLVRRSSFIGIGIQKHIFSRLDSYSNEQIKCANLLCILLSVVLRPLNLNANNPKKGGGGSKSIFGGNVCKTAIKRLRIQRSDSAVSYKVWMEAKPHKLNSTQGKSVKGRKSLSNIISGDLLWRFNRKIK